MTIENYEQSTTLQERLDEISSVNEQLTNHIRELEQSNDDLERAKRHLDATLADFDAKLNEQIERNELLESEIGEKEQLQMVIQRLKDEAKDLRLELMIQQNVKNNNVSINKKSSSITSDSEESPTPINTPTNSIPNKRFNRNFNFNHQVSNNENYQSRNHLDVDQTLGNHNHDSNATSVISPPSLNQLNNTTMKNSNQLPLLSASSRISALNIVSDLLRKVGALESKLASCRNITPNSNASSTSLISSKSSKISVNGKTIESVANSSTNDGSNALRNINANA